MKKRDFLALIVILILVVVCAVFLLAGRSEGKSLRVSRNNEVIEVLDLEENQQRDYTYDGEVNTVVIKDGIADVISANCQNQVCVNSAPIGEVGETIACLPHGLIFEVVGK